MFNRNQLVHLIFWPKGPNAMLELQSPDGEIVGEITLVDPARGSELSKMLPADFLLGSADCTVVSLSGEIKVSTKGVFDTAVVTERDKPSLEERFQRLERRERRREERERAQREAFAVLEKKHKELSDAKVTEAPVGNIFTEESEPTTGEGERAQAAGENPTAEPRSGE